MGKVAQWLGLEEPQPHVTLADLRELERAEKVTVAQEKGVSGTANVLGRIYSESNSRLQFEAAYGDGTGYNWGEWEKLVRTDPAVASSLDMVVAPIRDAEVDVEAAGEDELSIRIADFVRDNFLEWLEPLWPEVSQQIVRGKLTYGYSLHELVFGTRPDKRVPGGRAMYLHKLAQRLPSSVMPDGWVEEKGELAFIRQQGYRDGNWVHDLHLPANKVLLVSWNREGNNYQGFSAFRPVWYLAQVRASLLRIIGIAHQREASGIPVAIEGDETQLTAQQRTEVQKLLENLHLHENAAAVLPKGIKLEWFTSPGANKGHVVDTWKALGDAIHQVVQTQQISLGSSETGSRAVGEVHDGTKNAFVEGVKANIEAAVNGVGRRPYTGLVRRVVDPNFGPQAKYPKVTLVLKRPDVAVGELATAVPALANAGALTLTLDDENALRKRIGWAPIDREIRDSSRPQQVLQPREADRAPGRHVHEATPKATDAGAVENVQQTALNGAQVQAAQGIVQAVAEGRLPRDAALGMLETFFQITREAAEKVMGTVGTSFKPDPVAPPPAPKGLSDSVPVLHLRNGADLKLKRPLFAWEQHLALAEMAGFLEDGKEELAKALGKAVADAVEDARPSIAKAMKGKRFNPDKVQLDLKAVGRIIVRAAEKARAEGYRHVSREADPGKARAVLEEREEGEVGLSERVLKLEEDDRDTDTEPLVEPEENLTPGTGRTQSPAQVDAKVRRMVQAMRDRLLRRLRARVIDDIESEAIYVIRHGGGDVEEVVNRVAGNALEARGLKFDAGSVQAQAFSMGREQFAQEHGQDVRAVRYSAILDSRTCLPCNQADGSEFELNSPEHDAHVPPFRECRGGELCRCLLVYEFKRSGFQRREEAPA